MRALRSAVRADHVLIGWIGGDFVEEPCDEIIDFMMAEGLEQDAPPGADRRVSA